MVIAIELLDPKDLGRAQLRRVEGAFSASSIHFVECVVEPKSAALTDGCKGYQELAKQKLPSSDLLATGKPAQVVMPGVHTMAVLLKRRSSGTQVRLRPHTRMNT